MVYMIRPTASRPNGKVTGPPRSSCCCVRDQLAMSPPMILSRSISQAGHRRRAGTRTSARTDGSPSRGRASSFRRRDLRPAGRRLLQPPKVSRDSSWSLRWHPVCPAHRSSCGRQWRSSGCKRRQPIQRGDPVVPTFRGGVADEHVAMVVEHVAAHDQIDRRNVQRRAVDGVGRGPAR